MTDLSPYDPEIETLWRAVDGAGARSVAVVASLPGEGTSLIAEALARRAELAGWRPLRVNLSGTMTRAEGAAASGAPDGRIDPVAPEDMNAWREPSVLAAQIERWKAGWDLVIFDTSPVLTRDRDQIPATAVVAAAEATVLVALAGRTPAIAIRDAQSRLAAAGARLIGAVMNDHHNPPLLAELERELLRVAPFLPRLAAAIRKRLRNATLLTVRV